MVSLTFSEYLWCGCCHPFPIVSCYRSFGKSYLKTRILTSPTPGRQQGQHVHHLQKVRTNGEGAWQADCMRLLQCNSRLHRLPMSALRQLGEALRSAAGLRTVQAEVRLRPQRPGGQEKGGRWCGCRRRSCQLLSNPSDGTCCPAIWCPRLTPVGLPAPGVSSIHEPTAKLSPALRTTPTYGLAATDLTSLQALT